MNWKTRYTKHRLVNIQRPFAVKQASIFSVMLVKEKHWEE